MALLLKVTPSKAWGSGRTLLSCDSYPAGALLLQKGTKHRTRHISCSVCQLLSHIRTIPTGVPCSQGGGTSGHNEHSRSFASDQGGFSLCRHPGSSPRCSSLCNLSSRLLQYSCPTGRDVCCRCSAKEWKGHCRLLHREQTGEPPTYEDSVR